MRDGVSVAILPQLGASLAGLRQAGQFRRTLDYDLAAYQGRFDQVTWLSYAAGESRTFAEYAYPRVAVAAPRHPYPPLLWALAASARRAAILEASVLRVWNLSGVLPALVARAYWGRPYVLQLGYDHLAVARALGKWWKIPLIRALRRIAARRADLIFVPSLALAERWGVAADPAIRSKLMEMPNGVDTERFQPDADPEPRAKGAVLYVGRLSPEKNLLRLAEACRLIEARLVCVGQGPLATALAAAGSELHGPVPNEELPGWYTAAACFALPSLTEGSPKALLEAMAAGCPCVVSAQIALDFAVPGMVVPVNPALVIDIEAGIHAVRVRPPWVAEHIRSARAHVEGHHDLRALLRREVSLVWEVAHGHHR